MLHISHYSHGVAKMCALTTASGSLGTIVDLQVHLQVCSLLTVAHLLPSLHIHGWSRKNPSHHEVGLLAVPKILVFANFLLLSGHTVFNLPVVCIWFLPISCTAAKCNGLHFMQVSWTDSGQRFRPHWQGRFGLQRDAVR